MPSTTPMTPPTSHNTTASVTNCAMMFRFFAPTARRMPISRVRSVTHAGGGFEHADDVVFYAVKLDRLAHSRAMWEKFLRQFVADHTDEARAVHVCLQKTAPFLDHPVPANENVRRHTGQLNIGIGGHENGRRLRRPKRSLRADGRSQRGAVAQLFLRLQRE